MKIVVATGNKGKLDEITYMLNDYVETILPKTDFDVPPIEETGLTFVENAIIKAREVAKYSELPALADDSGLVVPALNGEPGVYSARYAGGLASDEDNNTKLLAAMADVPIVARRAYFVCALAFMKNSIDPLPVLAQGIWHGTILTEPRGENGFGYDPLFYIEERGCTAAEMNAEEKRHNSHRAFAMQSLKQQLKMCIK